MLPWPTWTITRFLRVLVLFVDPAPGGPGPNQVHDDVGIEHDKAAGWNHDRWSRRSSISSSVSVPGHWPISALTPDRGPWGTRSDPGVAGSNRGMGSTDQVEKSSPAATIASASTRRILPEGRKTAMPDTVAFRPNNMAICPGSTPSDNLKAFPRDLDRGGSDRTVLHFDNVDVLVEHPTEAGVSVKKGLVEPVAILAAFEGISQAVHSASARGRLPRSITPGYMLPFELFDPRAARAALRPGSERRLPGIRDTS